MKSKINTNTLVIAALFVALDIIVARFLAIDTGILKFDFQTVAAALCGTALNPFLASLTLITSDLVGGSILPGGLGFFWGFTVSAATRGAITSLFLYKKTITIPRIIVAQSITFIIVDLLMNTIWLSMLSKTPYIVLLTARLLPKMSLLIVQLILVILLKNLFCIIRTKVIKSKN